MSRIRSLALGTMLIFALSVAAQQTTPSPGAHSGVPSVEDHLKVLTAKLDLTGDQQAKLKPILQELNDATHKLMQDESMSHDERLEKVRACRYRADKKIREMLNDDQKEKLDQLEREPHPELHENH